MTDHVIFALAHLLPAAPADASASLPTRIKLLDIGLNQGADGRKWIVRDLAHAQEIVGLSAGKPAPIDFDHAIDLAAKEGRPAPAAGWMNSFSVDEQGIWADVEWTQRGGNALATKDYRYISPAFTHTKDGAVIAIKRAALTNNPNLDLPALAHQTENPEVNKEQLEALRKLLGLKADADVVAICSAVESMAAVVTGIKAKLALNAEAPVTEIATALNSVVERAGNADQVAELKSQVSDLQNNVLSLNSQLLEAKAKATGQSAEAKVDAAIKEGRITPAARTAALALASRSSAEFDEYLSKQPKIVTDGAIVPNGDPKPTAGVLSADELAICSQLGVTPEQYSATKKGAA
ncbi:phage protease [Ferrovibrio sp.]|uniref:phage protease n=1 Tax=Ferrovibrio sp. TaxID=1917215 RepID=UPI0035B3A750